MEKFKIRTIQVSNGHVIILDTKRIGFSPNSKYKNLELDFEGYDKIKEYKFSSIPWKDSLFFKDKRFFKPFNLFPFNVELTIDRIVNNQPKIGIGLTIELLNWSLSLSPAKFIEQIKAKFLKIGSFHFGGPEHIDLLEYTFIIKNSADIKKSINLNFNYHIGLLENIISETLNEINKNKKQLSFDTFFSFPEEYKTACEQYLLYFATFLKDLGIEAKTDLENQENGVLFKVYPKDKEEALTQIKEALDVYLGLPVQQNIEATATQFTGAAVQQLVANVYHLKSQLMFANATITRIQEKNRTLELFQYQNQPIILLNDTNEKPKNEEKIFGGIVTVKEYEGTGFNIDLPKLFRMMKRIWSK